MRHDAIFSVALAIAGAIAAAVHAQTPAATAAIEDAVGPQARHWPAAMVRPTGEASSARAAEGRLSLNSTRALMERAPVHHGRVALDQSQTPPLTTPRRLDADA